MNRLGFIGSRGFGRAAWALLSAALFTSSNVAWGGATIEIDEERKISIGAGLRTSFNLVEDGASSGDDYSKDFELDSFRLYVGGQMFSNVSFEFNTEYTSFDNSVEVLDGVLKFEFGDLFNLWAGRFLPPSDRSNLSGPYYLGTYDFPFVQQYPAIFAGRDEGVAYFGQVGEGMFKWQFGAFEGMEGPANDEDELLYAGRLTLNLWDPEPGYYNSSTYYGEKNIFAIGLVGMTQDDSVGPSPIMRGDFTGWNADLLVERNLGDGVGTLSLDAAWYDYDRDDLGTITDEGDGYFVTVSYLLPFECGPGKWNGRFQPQFRYQEFDPELSGVSDHDRWEIGLNYILSGHNARISLVYADDDPSIGSSNKIFRIGLQFQL